MIKKHINTFLIVFVCSAITLAFASTNNFGWSFLNWNSQANELSDQEVSDRVRTHAIMPVTEALQVRSPGMFMTKCYSEVVFEVRGKSIDELDHVYYENGSLQGNLILNDCGSHETICSFRINFSDNSVMVKESFLKEWESIDELTKRIKGESETEETLEEDE